ncbi:MAG: glycosyltransferase family 2 protein [Bacteroidetes bacterium]|nr:glycosyltransferase family 2 protein [Bacteroidota bacterium]
MLDLVIIIPTLNRPSILKDCLDSLKRQTIVTPMIYVIDQSDDTKTKELCKNYHVKYFKVSYKNKSRAANFGIGKTNSRYIAIVDDDVILLPDWLENIKKVLEENKYAYPVIQGQIIAGKTQSDTEVSRINDTGERRKVFKKKLITPIFKIGCNFIFSRDILEEVGLFDVNFGPGSLFLSADDAEWGYRVLNSGFKAIFEPSVQLIHQSWRNQQEDLKQMSDYGYGAGAFITKVKANSILDYMYHFFSIKRWLWYHIIFHSFNSKKCAPYKEYKRQFNNGIFAYKNNATI